ncbi:MAG: zinc ribbon domain-containing protein [Deltaproteobacteria bacterium]|jgi:putative FmdB family regulatory protein|nr:zinc ribbon domain-containing protein [Deltaproteobacteria bacterium]
MPIYEFKCQDCGREFETLVFSRSASVDCPVCGKGDCRKHLSSFSCGAPAGGTDMDRGSSSSSSCGSCRASSCAGCAH